MKIHRTTARFKPEIASVRLHGTFLLDFNFFMSLSCCNPFIIYCKSYEVTLNSRACSREKEREDDQNIIIITLLNNIGVSSTIIKLIIIVIVLTIAIVRFYH